MRLKTDNGPGVELQKFLEDLKTVVRDGEELLKVGATEVRQRAVAGAKSTDRLVRSHPYETLGIALGLGLVVGMLAAGACTCTSEAQDR